MAKESRQHTLDRVRPPRVQITYDVEKGDAIEQKELPFVCGVVGDLAGNASATQGNLKERKFVNVDPDNFDEVMEGVSPRVKVQVDNRLTNDGSKIVVEVGFKSMDDFQPENVVQQVEPLRRLIEARQKLSDLRNKVHSNEKLEEILEGVIADTAKLQQLGKETGH